MVYKEVFSNCCHTPVRLHQADEGTNCYVCTKCDKPCDLASAKNLAEMKKPEMQRVECEGVGDNNGFYVMSFPKTPTPQEGWEERYGKFFHENQERPFEKLFWETRDLIYRERLLAAEEEREKVVREIGEKISEMKIGVGYSEENKPTLQDEVIALAFESNADAFFAGFDKALEIIRSFTKETK